MVEKMEERGTTTCSLQQKKFRIECKLYDKLMFVHEVSFCPVFNYIGSFQA